MERNKARRWRENNGTFQSTKKNNNFRIKPPDGFKQETAPQRCNNDEEQGEQDPHYAKFLFTYIF